MKIIVINIRKSLFKVLVLLVFASELSSNTASAYPATYPVNIVFSSKAEQIAALEALKTKAIESAKAKRSQLDALAVENAANQMVRLQERYNLPKTTVVLPEHIKHLQYQADLKVVIDEMLKTRKLNSANLEDEITKITSFYNHRIKVIK